MNISLVLWFDRLSTNKLDEAEKKSAAVKSGDGKEIENTYIYGYQRRYIKQIEYDITLILSLLSGDLTYL